MTLKTMINDVEDELAQPRSTTVATATEANTLQLLALANREGRELMRRYPWEALRKEHTFLTVAAEEQTNAFPSPNDFDRFIEDSQYNRTRHRRITLLTSSEWQAQQGLTASVLTDSFIIRGSAWLAEPTPAAGDTNAYEYVSKNWCQSSGGTAQSAWAADDDTGILDEELMGLGLIWRWKRAKGFDYSEEFNTYQIQVMQAMQLDGGKRRFNFAQDNTALLDARPPTVPEGSWSL